MEYRFFFTCKYKRCDKSRKEIIRCTSHLVFIRRRLYTKVWRYHNCLGLLVRNNEGEEGALGVGIWRWWPPVVISSVIFVRPPIASIIVTRITPSSEVTWRDVRGSITTATTAVTTRTVSITRWSWRVPVIITEGILSWDGSFFVKWSVDVCIIVNVLPLLVHVHIAISLSVSVSMITAGHSRVWVKTIAFMITESIGKREDKKGYVTVKDIQ